jgi:O-antigen/teichoic acid export membrane protein
VPSAPPTHDPALPGARRAIDHKRRGTVGGMATSIYVSALLGLVTGPLVGRALGPIGRGEVASAVVYGLLAGLVMTVGVPFAIGHAAARRPGIEQALLGTAMRQALVLGPVAIVAAILVVQYPLSHLSPAGRAGAFVLIALGPLDFVTKSQRMIMQARGHLRPLARLWLAPFLLTLVVTTILYAFSALTVGSYLITQVSAGLMVNLASWWALPLRPAGSVPMRPLLSFGLRGFGASLSSFGNRQIDQIFLVSAVATPQLGLYAIAVTIANLPLGVGQALGARAFGEVARAPDEDEGEAAARYLRVALLAGIALSIGLALSMPVVLPLLYGDAFRGAVVPLLILLPGTAALSYSATASQTLMSIGRPGANTVAELVGLGVTIPGLLIAIPIAGIKGAAAVSTIAYISRAIAQTVVLKQAGVGSVRPRFTDAVDVAQAIALSLQRKNPLSRRAQRRSHAAHPGT